MSLSSISISTAGNRWLQNSQFMPVAEQRRSAESLLAKIKESERARLRIYIGAAAGVGKTFRMLEEAHELRRQRSTAARSLRSLILTQ